MTHSKLHGDSVAQLGINPDNPFFIELAALPTPFYSQVIEPSLMPLLAFQNLSWMHPRSVSLSQSRNTSRNLSQLLWNAGNSSLSALCRNYTTPVDFLLWQCFELRALLLWRWEKPSNIPREKLITKGNNVSHPLSPTCSSRGFCHLTASQMARELKHGVCSKLQNAGQEQLLVKKRGHSSKGTRGMNVFLSPVSSWSLLRFWQY